MNSKDRISFRGQEFRAVGVDNDKIIEGHAAVFEQTAEVGDFFYEVINRGAFDGCDLKDVPLLVNHDLARIPLARSRRNNGSSTMTLTVDDIGLAIRAKLDVDNNPDARKLYSAVERGDLDGMSFAFVVDDAEWLNLDSDMPTRRIKKIKQVLDVSACTFPVYSQTDLHARAKSTLESAKRALDNARAQSSTNDKATVIELFRLKNRILGGI